MAKMKTPSTGPELAPLKVKSIFMALPPSTEAR